MLKGVTNYNKDLFLYNIMNMVNIYNIILQIYIAIVIYYGFKMKGINKSSITITNSTYFTNSINSHFTKK